MNLLLDPWIPVRDERRLRQIRYRDLLCEDYPWRISLPRDDMELACLQLLVSLTQVVFLPEDKRELGERIQRPITHERFDAGVAQYRAWFDLDHPDIPFMQVRGVNGKLTSPQKLLAGLPERTSTSPSAHCFFNEIDEINHLGVAGAAIAMFNQAMDSPSFGGGFKGSLRGGAPITTLISGKSLRDTVWRNVLHLGTIRKVIPWYDETKAGDEPTWVRPITSGEKIQVNEIGLIRGLFWQPAHIELIHSQESLPCDLIGGPSQVGYIGFVKEQFDYKMEGLWPHLHGPRNFSTKKGESKEYFLSFTTTSPTWTHFNKFLFERLAGKEGSTPAAVIKQYKEISAGEPLVLIVGGYHVENGASFIQRRHELFSVAAGWETVEMELQLTELIEYALDSKDALGRKLSVVATGIKELKLKTGKVIKAKGGSVNLKRVGENLFYQRTENMIHESLRELTPRAFNTIRRRFADHLTVICREIFEEVTTPYSQNPALIRTIALARRGLNSELNKLQEGVA